MRKAVAAICFLITACAAPPPAPQTPSLRPAFEALTIGKSTKADVRAALGEGMVIDFDSGYEVWVYRETLRDKSPPLKAEFVLLFAPSGILTKTRIR